MEKKEIDNRLFKIFDALSGTTTLEAFGLLESVKSFIIKNQK